MAVHDHTAPAHLSFSSLGDPFADSLAAGLPAHRPQAHSLRLSTLDDVALALHCLAQLCIEDERYRTAWATHCTTKPMAWPLPPLFKLGVTVAIQCLEQYTKQLSDERATKG
jgi:hypothetical protein